MGNFKAKINISSYFSSSLETKTFIKSLYNALQPETKVSTLLIDSYILNRDCIPSLVIEITTSDLAELRSFINSYLRLIKAINLCITNLLIV
ncbi:MAG TPA: KEOPS complex subunit Pcc1 [Nitrososphaeraceae archaeon]|nr:KEOPS complex subunit Pcc1 [Nitrososphaeraceae archaeon]